VEEVTQEETYRSPYIKYNPKETEEEREFRLSGLAKPNSSKKKSEKRNTAKFSDEIKSNPRLREIYEQLMKEKEERDKIIKSNNKVKESS
jgi:cytochrome c-type biogenesis protein CcmE